MKSLKRLFTIAICLTLLASFAFIAPLGTMGRVYAATTNVGKVLTVQNLSKKGEVGQTLTIPKANIVGSDEKVVPIIKDPRGRVIDENSAFVGNYADNATSISFVPRQVGYYTVEYKIANDITRTQVYSIYVDGTEPKISFKDNAQVYIPEKIYDAKEVELPLPVVTDGNLEEVENLVMLIKNGDNAQANNAETNPSNYPVVWVSAKGPNYEVINLVKRDGKIYFNATKDADENFVYGTYTIKYEYSDANSSLSTTKYVSIVVEKDYKENVVDKVDMTFVWENGKSLPTSGVLGQDLVLPRPIAQDKNQSNAEIQSYTTVKINFVPEGNVEQTENWISYTDKFDYDKFSFVPMNKTINGGYYLVEYTITDYFGNKLEKTYTIKNITDSVKPEVYLVGSYTLENAANGNVDLTDLTYYIPSKIIVGCNQDIVLPAIYATDNYVDFANLTIKRYFESYELNYDINQTITLNANDAESDLPQGVKNYLNTAGTYTIKYQASDGTNTNTISIQLVVLADNEFVDATAPKITFDLNEKVAYAGDEFTFKAPTVVDYVKDGVNIDTKNCKVEVGYYFGTEYASFKADFDAGKAIEECADHEHFAYIEKLEDNDKYYSFEIPNVDEIHVLVRAFDRAKFGGVNTETTAEDNKTIKDVKIRVINKDELLSVAPTFDTAQIVEEIADVAQNTKYEIVSKDATGAFVFEGEKLDFAVVNVRVYDPNGKQVSVRGASTNATNNEISVKGAYFTTTTKGDYVVTLTATLSTDEKQTFTVVSYTVKVKDTIPPMIEINNLPSIVTVGEAITLPDCVMIDDGVEQENQATVSIDFDNQDNPGYHFVPATNKFTALEEGTFTFVYRVDDGENPVVERTVTITAVASSSSNNLTLSESNWIDTAQLKSVTVNGSEQYCYIAVPYLNPENAVDGIKSYTVKVKNPNGADIAIKELKDINLETEEIINNTDENNIYGVFKPTSKDGKYTVTYVVEDNASNQYTLTKTLTVGDQEPPEIKVKDDVDLNKVLPTTMELGSTLEINYDDFEFNDNTTKNKNEFTFKATIKDTTGETKTLEKKDGLYTYEFAEAGTYTLTYTLTDKAGNVATRSTEINVEAEEAEDTHVTTIIAGVLIAVFVVLCAGIVVYFVIVNRKPKVKVENVIKEQ